MGLKAHLVGLLERKPTASKPYLIEARLYGYGEKFAIDISKEIARLFGARLVLKKTRPTHLPLYGRFETANEKEMIKHFVSICRRFDLITFEITGFERIGEAVCLKIKPSPELVNFRNSLVLELNHVCESQNLDEPGGFAFRAVLPLASLQKKAGAIWKFLEAQKKPGIKQYLLRVSLIKKGRVLKEYDFIQRRILSKGEAASKPVLNQTMKRLKKIMENDGKRKIST